MILHLENPSATYNSQARAAEVKEAWCLELIFKHGSCCLTLFEHEFPDLYNIFDRQNLKYVLMQQEGKFRKDLKAKDQEHTIPPNL